jgi:hypothetical protein
MGGVIGGPGGGRHRGCLAGRESTPTEAARCRDQAGIKGVVLVPSLRRGIALCQVKTTHSTSDFLPLDAASAAFALFSFVYCSCLA